MGTSIKHFGKWIAGNFDEALAIVLLRLSIRIPLPERNPFQLVLLIFIALADLAVVLHSEVGPPSLISAGYFGKGVTWVILIGAVGGIFGLLHPDREVGLAFEQYCHSVLCFGSWGYVFVVVAYNGLSSGILVAGYTAGVAVGAWARACHILFFNRQMAIITGRSHAHLPGGPERVSSGR